MPVERYTVVTRMSPARRGDPRDPATYARIKALWRFSSRLLPPLYSRGVYRFRSIEDSQVARERATIDRMRAMRASR